MTMRWFHWLRGRFLPVTPAAAQKRVDAIDHALAALRAEVASLPAHERAAHAQDVRALLTEQAHARNVLSDTLDNRVER
jgi:hypothetical protein